MAGNSLLDTALSRNVPNQSPANPLIDVADLPGVPTGVDGAPGPSSADVLRMQEEAARQRARGAILAYGDTTIIPSLTELGEGALNGLNRFGEAALAFGPQGEMLSAPVEALGTAIRAYRAAPRAGTAAIVGERALTKPTQEQALTGLRGEVDTLSDQARQLGVAPEVRPDIALSPEEEINALTFARDSLKGRLAEKQSALDATNAAAPRTSVPSVDGISPIRERAEMIDAITGNPYVQPIPGRQGFPTKREQIDLANQFFDTGGRLDAPGPWGRDVPQAIRGVMQGTVNPRARSIEMDMPSNLPGGQDLMNALNASRQEAANLAGRLRNARSNDEVIDLQKQLEAVRRRSDSFMRMWETEKAKNLPKP